MHKKVFGIKKRTMVDMLQNQTKSYTFNIYIYIYMYIEDLALITYNSRYAIRPTSTKSYIFDIYVLRGLNIK